MARLPEQHMNHESVRTADVCCFSSVSMRFGPGAGCAMRLRFSHLGDLCGQTFTTRASQTQADL